MAKKKDENLAKPPLLEVNVSFKGCSINGNHARLGASTMRASITPSKMDREFCGKRLKGKIVGRRSGGSEQPSLPGANVDPELTGVFDVKSYSVTPDGFSFGMCFLRSDIGDGALDPFVGLEGVLTVEETAAIPKEEAAKGKEEEDGE